jgi:hypothetical protein
MAPVVVYRMADSELIRRLNEETATCAGDWVCGPSESEDVQRALALPRVRAEYHIKHEGGETRVAHRLVVDAASPRPTL